MKNGVPIFQVIYKRLMQIGRGCPDNGCSCRSSGLLRILLKINFFYFFYSHMAKYYYIIE